MTGRTFPLWMSGLLGLLVMPLAVPALAADPALAARVNGKPILLADVVRFADRVASQAKSSREKVWKDVLDQMITTEVLWQAGKAAGLEPTTAEFETALKEAEQIYQRSEKLRKRRAARDDAEFREEVRRNLAVEKLLAAKVSVVVPAEAIEAYFRENPEEFDMPPMVRARHLLVRIDDSRPEAARQRAEDLLARARRKGEDFAGLIRKESDDERTKEDGGDLGFFPHRGTPVAQAAFALAPGEISDLVKSEYGWHILQVTERQEGGPAKLDDVREEIQELLEEELRLEKEEAYVEALLAEAKVELLQPTAPAVTAPGTPAPSR